MKYHLFIIGMLRMCFIPFAESQEKFLTVGLQLKPIIPSGLFRTDNVFKSQENMFYSITTTFGYSGGMMIRKEFSKRFSFETGINFTKRNYNLDIIDNDSIVDGHIFAGYSDFSIINYEIPLLGLLYLRIGERWHMNTSVGVSMDFFPSDISTYDSYFSHLALRNHWLQLAGVVNHGYELRTDKSGMIYFGGTLHWPFTIIYRSFIDYKTGLLLKDQTTLDLKGNYFTIDVRYYFPERQEKKRRK